MSFDDPEEKNTKLSPDVFDLQLGDLIRTHFRRRELDDAKIKAVGRDVRALLARHGIAHVATAPEDAAETNDGLLSPTDDDDDKHAHVPRIIRVEDMYMSAWKLDQRDTLAKACCGKQAANRIYRFYRKFGLYFFAVFLIGTVLLPVSIIGIVPTWLSVVAVAMVTPSQILNFSLLNKTITLQLFREWETYYLTFLNLVVMVSYCDLVRMDIRAIAIIWGWIVNMSVLTLNDAQHASSGRYMAVGYIVAACVFLSVMVVFQLGVARDIHNRQIQMSPFGFTVTLDVLLFANNRQLTVIGFILKNTYLKFRHPDAFAVLRARIVATKMTTGDLQTLLDRRRRASTIEQYSASTEGENAMKRKIASAASASFHVLRKKVSPEPNG